MRECIDKFAQRIRFMSNTLEVVLPNDTNNSRTLWKPIIENIEDAQQGLTRVAKRVTKITVKPMSTEEKDKFNEVTNRSARYRVLQDLVLAIGLALGVIVLVMLGSLGKPTF
jgi:hypothetical protein